MEMLFIVLGAGCLIAAVVGGGVKMRQQETHMEIPLVQSLRRQVILAALGMGFIAFGLHLQAENERKARELIDGIQRLGSGLP